MLADFAVGEDTWAGSSGATGPIDGAPGLYVGAWRNAVDGERVDSIGVDFLSPFGDRTAIELRLAQDDSETFGRSNVLSAFLYVFEGS